MLLELQGVSKRFGGLTAVDALSTSVTKGTIHGLIGPNGAGKSTVFNLISGVLPLSGGAIFFKGARISGLRPSEICRRGIARTFQATTLFREYTALQNVLVAAHLRSWAGLGPTLYWSRPYRRKEAAALEWARALLRSLNLDGVAYEVVGRLRHRDQKALSLGMALATGAELLMLDEPMAGLTVEETRQMMELLIGLRDQGATILLVEHDMRAIMGVCDVITALDHGVGIAEGPPREIRENSAVIEAYLGAEERYA